MIWNSISPLVGFISYALIGRLTSVLLPVYNWLDLTENVITFLKISTYQGLVSTYLNNSAIAYDGYWYDGMRCS